MTSRIAFGYDCDVFDGFPVGEIRKGMASFVIGNFE